MEALRLRILGISEPIVKGAEAKPKISAEKDVWVDSTAGQVV